MTRVEPGSDAAGRAGPPVVPAAALDQVTDGMFVLDHAWRCVYLNEAGARLVGRRRADLVGRTIWDAFPEVAGSGFDHQFRRALETGEVVEFEERYAPLGTWFEVRVFPSEIGLTISYRDVTERRRAESERDRLEAQLRNSLRLESVGQLAGGIAHDFNNLLAVILNYASVVRTGIVAAGGDGVQWEGVRADVDQIARAAERAGHLTRQLLAFAQRDTVRLAALDLNAVVTDLGRTLRQMIGEDVALETSLGPRLPAILADAGQIEQVLLNLAVNGCDAMPAGGRLTVETAAVLVDVEHAAARPGADIGTYVRLRVSDTGAGMAPDVLERVFDPFYSTKPVGEGSGLGLGLATVHGIVARAGGVVDLYSEPGLGTTVSVLFPAVESDPALPVVASPPDPSPGRGETVLVVEDEPALRDVARRILERHGYKVLCSPDGPAAVDLVRAHAGPIDLLLTDVVMPALLGRDLADKVTAVRPRTRVVYMSGYAVSVLDSRGRLPPGVALLEKPFSERALISAVACALSGATSGARP